MIFKLLGTVNPHFVFLDFLKAVPFENGVNYFDTTVDQLRTWESLMLKKILVEVSLFMEAISVAS